MINIFYIGSDGASDYVYNFGTYDCRYSNGQAARVRLRLLENTLQIGNQSFTITEINQYEEEFTDTEGNSCRATWIQIETDEQMTFRVRWHPDLDQIGMRLQGSVEEKRPGGTNLRF